MIMFNVLFQTMQLYGPIMHVDYMVAKNETFRPTIPEYSESETKLIELMKKCWSHNPLSRPSFEEICQELSFNQ